MNPRNENKKDFHETSIGWLPTQWKVLPLEEIAVVTMGQSPDSKFYNIDGEGLPLIQGNADCKNGKTWPRYWTTQITKTCDNGDLILSVRAPVGSVARSSHHACIGRGVCSIKPTESSDFLFHTLVSLEKSWVKISQGSIFDAVTSSQVKKFKIAFPPIEEQVIIAKTIFAWDHAIDRVQRLIEAKQRLKKGLMQGLLTGRLRFPEFGVPIKKDREVPDGWNDYKLSEIIEIINGGTPARNNPKYWNGDIPWIAVGDFSGVNRYVSKTKESITVLGLHESSTNMLLSGDVIISARGTVGSIAQLKKPMAFNQTSYGLKAKQNVVTGDFLFYLLRHITHRISDISHGAIFDTITRDTFDSIKILLPTLNEQINITKTLTLEDSFIELLEEKLKALERQKKGLLQKLLTGEIRVKVN